MNFMEHIIIFGIILSLVIGTWVASSVILAARLYHRPFLKIIAYHTILYNLLIGCLLIFVYFEFNLARDMDPDHPTLGGDLLILLSALFEVSMVYMMVRIVSGFRDRKMPLWQTGSFAGLVFVLVLTYLMRCFLPLPNPMAEWIQIFHSLIFNNFLPLEIPVLIVLLVLGRRCQESGRRRIILGFGWLYLSRYMVLLLVPILTLLPRPARFSIALGLFMMLNFTPYIWIRYFFIPHAESLISLVRDRSVLSGIYEKYNISKREREILELIVDGNTNQEIEKTLFISYNTVKNHIYNLYRKLGVKSRHELWHFVTKFQKE
jgi:DNA-binding CsgD family transcriptional regulator